MLEMNTDGRLDEAARAAFLASSEILDTAAEESFDRIANLAAQIMTAPIALVSLADTNRLWFKARVGIDASEIPREGAFCDYAIRAPDALVIPDTTADARFKDNPLVTGAPYVRFYAGAQLRTQAGVALGTLCVLGLAPHHPDADAVAALKDLTRGVVAELELRRANAELRRHAAHQAQLAEALRQDRQRLQDFLAATSDTLWETDDALKLVSIGGARLTEREPDTLIGKTFVEVARATGMAEPEVLSLAQDLADRRRIRSVEFSRTAGDEVLWMEASGRPVFDAEGGFIGYRGVTRDITSRKRREEQVRKLADEDPLTGLPNRRTFDSRLQALLAADCPGAVLLLDIDRFKQVNDTYGHDAGDALVRAIGARIAAQIRSGDTVARIGGDEFAVVLNAVGERGVRSIARRILKAASEPFVVEERSITASLSIGAVLVPRDAAASEEAVRRADLALYRSKHDGRARFSLYAGQELAA